MSRYLFLSKPQAWHIITARSAVHIIKGGKPPLHIITRQRASYLRLDDIQHFVLMIYRNKLRMIYKACALIKVRLYVIRAREGSNLPKPPFSGILFLTQSY